MPSFSRMPARITEPPWAPRRGRPAARCGSGNIGTLMAKVSANAANSQICWWHGQVEPQQVGVGEAPDAAVQPLEGPGHPEDGDQHQQAAGHGVEEELDRRVDPPLAAPDADQEVHRDQHDLPEDVEEEEVVGDQGAEHAGGEQQHGGAEERPVLLDPLPRAEDHDRQQEDAEHHQRHRDAVHRQVVLDAVARDPGERAAAVVDQREAAVRSQVGEEVQSPEEDLDQRDDQRVDLRRLGLRPGEEEQRHRREGREEDEAGQRIADEQSEKGFHISDPVT